MCSFVTTVSPAHNARFHRRHQVHTSLRQRNTSQGISRMANTRMQHLCMPADLRRWSLSVHCTYPRPCACLATWCQVRVVVDIICVSITERIDVFQSTAETLLDHVSHLLAFAQYIRPIVCRNPHSTNCDLRRWVRLHKHAWNQLLCSASERGIHSLHVTIVQGERRGYPTGSYLRVVVAILDQLQIVLLQNSATHDACETSGTVQ